MGWEKRESQEPHGLACLLCSVGKQRPVSTKLEGKYLYTRFYLHWPHCTPLTTYRPLSNLPACLPIYSPTYLPKQHGVHFMLANQTLAWGLLQSMSDTPLTMYWRKLIRLYEEVSIVPVFFISGVSQSDWACTDLVYAAKVCEFICIPYEPSSISLWDFSHRQIFLWIGTCFLLHC